MVHAFEAILDIYWCIEHNINICQDTIARSTQYAYTLEWYNMSKTLQGSCVEQQPTVKALQLQYLDKLSKSRPRSRN